MVCLKSDIHGHGMPCSSLRNLTHLQSLNLSQNKLEELPAGLFDGLGLTLIDLSHNNLTVLDAQLFDLENLTTLDLRGNRLTESIRQDLARLTVELHVWIEAEVHDGGGSDPYREMRKFDENLGRCSS